jgi:hypothetical protein
MRYAVITLLGLMVFASGAIADTSCARKTSVQNEPTLRAKARAHDGRCDPGRLAYRYGIGFYPPTYIVDGRSYFYFPGSNGRPDEPVQPIPEDYDY